MSKIGGWRKIFGYAEKPKKPVQVGEKVEELTGTQAYRFEELTQSRRHNLQPEDNAAERKSLYTLTEAVDSLRISEERLLQEAVSGSVCLYLDAAGLRGCWRRGAADEDSLVTAVLTVTSGYLALSSRSCGEMARFGSINVEVLESLSPNDSAAAVLDRETMATLAAWGDCQKHFCLVEPLWVDRDKIILLAPLPVLDEQTLK